MKNLQEDVAKVKALLASSAEALCQMLLPGGKRVGREWCAGDVRGGPGNSLKVALEGVKAGTWCDFAGAADEKGDLLALWMGARGCDFKTALHDAAHWLGLPINGNGRGGTTIRMVPAAVGQSPLLRQLGANEAESGQDLAGQWLACVAAMTDPELEELAKWRGLRVELCRWLKTHGLIGKYGKCIAFPVHDATRMVGWHYHIKAENSWRYHPAGVGARPFIIGDMAEGTMSIWAFESQWDLLAALDACGWPEKPQLFVAIATRGASNGARLAEVIEAGSSVILWPQHDPINKKTGKRPGTEWANDAARALPSCSVKLAEIPNPDGVESWDVGDWHQQGASFEDFKAVLRSARVVHGPNFEVGERDSEAYSLPDPGPFPLSSLPPVMRAVVQTVAETYELPYELAGMAALATWAGAIGKAAVVRGAVNGRDTYCNLYIFAGAPKSFGKGSAGAVVRPFLDLSQQLSENFREQELPDILSRLKIAEKESVLLVAQIVNGKSLAEADKRELKARHVDIEREVAELKRLVDGLPSYHAGSATGAALSQALRRNDGTVFSYSPEAGDMVRVALGRYTADGKADCDLLLSGYTVEPFKELRVGRGESSFTPCITALWFCQTALLQEIIRNEEAFQRGLTARPLIFCCAWEGAIPYDDGKVRDLNTAAVEAWRAALTEVVKRRAAREQSIIMCDAEAREVFRAFHNETVDYRNGRFADIEAELGRWRENAIRIAGGMAVAEGVSRISGELATRAVALARWGHLSGLALMNGRAEEQRRARLDRIMGLAREAGGEITLRLLKKNHGVSETEVEHLARLHPSQLIIAEKCGEKGGRPSRILRLLSP